MSQDRHSSSGTSSIPDLQVIQEASSLNALRDCQQILNQLALNLVRANLDLSSSPLKDQLSRPLGQLHLRLLWLIQHLHPSEYRSSDLAQAQRLRQLLLQSGKGFRADSLFRSLLD